MVVTTVMSEPSPALENSPIESAREDALIPYPELGAVDICTGADPYVFQYEGKWRLLMQEDIRPDPHVHTGIDGYTIRSADRIEDLPHSTPVPLTVATRREDLKQVWAGEIHFDNHLYVAVSNGDNRTHRTHIFKTEGGVEGPWKDIGPLTIPSEDDRWAIDITAIKIPHGEEGERYAVWSGWEEPSDAVAETDIPTQHIYIAKWLSPTEIGRRHLIASPNEDWTRTVAPILEGPQELVIDGEFKGLLITGNASWTEHYATRILKYAGGDPLSPSSWSMCSQPLFNDGYGIGHGIIVQDGETLYYIGHRKTRRTHGWEDRKVFYTKLDKEKLLACLEAKPSAA